MTMCLEVKSKRINCELEIHVIARLSSVPSLRAVEIRELESEPKASES